VREIIIYDEVTLKHWAQHARNKGYEVAWTNGVFDLFHIGHAEYLAEVKEQAEREAGGRPVKLVVGVNSDASVESLKGPGRPVIPIMRRMRVVACHYAVDAVVWFDEPTPLALIELVKPKWVYKDELYKDEGVIGQQVAEACGGGARYVRRRQYKGASTTDIIELIRNTPQGKRDGR